MPRHADPSLEAQILDAAARLWKKGGGKALTMRAVARAAHTTTPTIYQRFKNREDILRALLRRIRQEVVEVLQACRSPQEAYRRYVEFALNRPHEYALFYAYASELFYTGRRDRPSATQVAKPGVELMKAKLAQWLGGSPEEHKRLHLVLWALAHGTSMLLISRALDDDLSPELLTSCEAAVTALVKNASSLAAAK